MNQGEQPLALLRRLAEVLAVDLPDLLPRAARRHRGTGAEPSPAGPAAADARVVGAALHAIGVLVPIETLARVLSWDMDRLKAALDQLTTAAEAVGLRLHRQYNRVCLGREVGALPAEQLQAVSRYDTARSDLDLTPAQLVHAALQRAVTASAGGGGAHMLAKSNPEKVAAGALVGAGVLALNAAGDLELNAAAAMSLFVNESPGNR